MTGPQSTALHLLRPGPHPLPAASGQFCTELDGQGRGGSKYRQTEASVFIAPASAVVSMSCGCVTSEQEGARSAWRPEAGGPGSAGASQLQGCGQPLAAPARSCLAPISASVFPQPLPMCLCRFSPLLHIGHQPSNLGHPKSRGIDQSTDL